MAKKQKFKPRISKVKLQPEQAVLACTCYDTGFTPGSTPFGAMQGCYRNTKTIVTTIYNYASNASSS
jgi:hypothetical protein